jgi:uncharacterized protein YbaP (TraB family)
MNKYTTLFTIVFTFLFFSPTAKSQSLLWEISGNGLEESSYLFGTVHLSDQRVFNFNDSVFAKIDECDAFTMEIEATSQNIKKIGNSIFLEDGKTIDQMVSKEDYAFLTKFFKEKLDLELDGLKIFTPMTIISMATLRLTKSDMDTSVDNFLYEYATSKNKKTFSVEPLQLQIDLLKNVPADYLIDVANEWDTYQGITDKMIVAYAKEDMDALIKIMFSDSGFKKMEDDFIWNRNKTMADSIDLFVNRQSTFIAIGTGHLPLEGGVIDLLQKKGYEVKPIIAAKTKELPEIKKNENWITLAPEEAGFSIEMPKQPEYQEFDKASEVGSITLKLYSVEMSEEDENFIYGMAITDYPTEKINAESMTKSELDNYYEASLLGAANGVNGKIVNRGEVKLDSFIAKTADVEAYDGLINIRYAILLRNNRLFLLQVLSKGNLENNELLNKFFKSFKLEDYDLEKSTLENIPSKKWETIESKEENFSLSILGKTIGRRNHSAGTPPKNSDPIYYLSEIIDDDENQLLQYIIISNFPEGFIADSLSTENLIEFYDNNLSESLEDGKGEIITKKEIKIQSQIAQRSEYILYNEGFNLHVHSIRLLHKNKFYILQHATVGKKATEEEINKFLQSFKILEE